MKEAATTATDGARASGAVAKALKTGHADEAMAAFKNVTGTCKPCHDARREKGADGNWKIKGS
ncbi:MAG: cytochrome c [Acidobacteria bacterium]|nr:cytochrome c [Acidobacteriota bacterium]